MNRLFKLLRRNSAHPAGDFLQRVRAGVIGVMVITAFYAVAPQSQKEMALDRARAATERAIHWTADKFGGHPK